MARLTLHIAQICSSRSWGGLEMHVAVLSRWLTEEGHRVEVWCSPGSPLADEAQRLGLPVIPFAPAGYLDMAAALRLFRQIRERGVELLHAHYARDLWNIAPAVYLGRRWPLVFIKHIGTSKPKRDPLHRWIYNAVDQVVAISRVIAENLLATHPLEAERVRIVHHGVDTRTFVFHPEARARIRAEWGVGEEELLIGSIGRLQSGKGHLEFLDMAAAVSARHPQVRFVIVGEPTRGEEERARPIYERLNNFGLEGRVIMAGFRSDIPEVLAAMDIFAFPSRAEAFGLVLIEAMAVGRPVVSTRCDGVLDIIEEERNGLLFDPGDSGELARQVERLIVDKELRLRLGHNGLLTVAARFSRTAMLNRLYRVYEQAGVHRGVQIGPLTAARS